MRVYFVCDVRLCVMQDLGILGETVRFAGFSLNCFQIMHFKVRAGLKRDWKLHYTVISKKEIQNMVEG